MVSVYLCKKPLHPWILRRKYIFPGPLSGRFMKEKDNGIDALGKIVTLQALYGFVNAVLSQNIMNVRLHSRIQGIQIALCVYVLRYQLTATAPQYFLQTAANSGVSP